MSLSTINSPPLVAAAGAFAFSALPVLEQAIVNGDIGWKTVKGLNVLAYGLNVISTSRPGRIDGSAQRIGEDGFEGAAEMKKLSTQRQGITLVAPSGWAFIIWGPIFLGELVFVTSSLFLEESSTVAPVIKKLSAPFQIAQVFQSLWAASFRPKYKGDLMLISASMLSGIAWSLNYAHSAFAKSKQSYGTAEYLMYFLPISLHFGWTTAASLVNLNGAVALKDGVSAKSIALLGHASAIGAAVLGAFVSLTRKAPVYGAVIAWALTAVADGMRRRLEKADKESKDRPGIYGAQLQQRLCTVGAIVSAGASAVASFNLLSAPTN